MTIQATPWNKAGRRALDIFNETLQEIRGDRLVIAKVRLEDDSLHVADLTYDLTRYKRIIVAGAGKASASMAGGLEVVLGRRISEGLIVTKYGHGEPLQYCRLLEAGHPVLDGESLRAGEEMLKLAEGTSEGDLVIYLLSGGASALLEAPTEGISLHDLQITYEELLNSGATIMTLNTIRSRLSRIKAGGLAKAFRRADVVVLCLSDVERDLFSVIGSGPFFRQNTMADLPAVLQGFQLMDKLPDPVLRQLLKEPADEEVPPRPPHKIVGNRENVYRAAIKAAKALNFDASGIHMSGVANEYVWRLQDNSEILGDDGLKMTCLVGFGETVVRKTGKGLGGRAQEMACSFAHAIQGKKEIAVLVAGTDGTDGPTDVAGALVDGQTIARAAEKGFEYFKTLFDNDSYHFHEAAGTLIKTGPTGTNLNDIFIVIRR